MAGRKSKFAELRIFELENMTVNGAIRILNGKDERRKFELIKNLAPKVLARRISIGGDKENPLTLTVYLPERKVEKHGGNGVASSSSAGVILPKQRL